MYLHFSDLGDPRSIPITPIIFPFFFSSLFCLGQGGCGINLPKAHSFSLNLSLNFLTYSRGCEFNTHSSHLFFSFIFLLTLSSIQEVVGSISTLHIHFFSFIFLLTFSSIQEVVGSISTHHINFPLTLSSIQEVVGSIPLTTFIFLLLFFS